MLINDSVVQARSRKLTPQEKHAADVAAWIAEEEKRAVLVEDTMLINPASFDQQVGRPITSAELEMKLGKILPPNIIFISNPFVRDKRAAVRVLPNGARETIVPYEAGWMPEHSVFDVKVEWIRDKSITHFTRKDMAKSSYEITPSGIMWTSDHRPGWKKVIKLWNEKKRGWRTVLIRLVQNNLMTPTQAERLFGSDDRVQWANAMGKRSVVADY